MTTSAKTNICLPSTVLALLTCGTLLSLDNFLHAEQSSTSQAASPEVAGCQSVEKNPSEKPPQPKCEATKKLLYRRALQAQIRADVKVLADEIGERHLLKYGALVRAADFIEKRLKSSGFEVLSQRFPVRGRSCRNLECEISGTECPEEIVVVGAHYDCVPSCPGANDNGSGVAALLSLAKIFSKTQTSRTLRFVAFTNEEAPFFHTDKMGSLKYARRCAERHESIMAMLSLETMGYYSDQENSQKYPLPFNQAYPNVANFIGFVGNLKSASLVNTTVASFRRHASIPCEGGAFPESIPGVGWSDQWSFWKYSYRALMVTDTAPFRYPHYHAPSDTPDKLDYDRLALVVEGLQHTIYDLVQATPQTQPSLD